MNNFLNNFSLQAGTALVLLAVAANGCGSHEIDESRIESLEHRVQELEQKTTTLHAEIQKAKDYKEINGATPTRSEIQISNAYELHKWAKGFLKTNDWTSKIP